MPKDPQPWDRREDETAAEYEWFNHYLKIGPTYRAHSMVAASVAHRFSQEERTIRDVMARVDWAGRAAAYDDGWVDRDVTKQLAARVKAAEVEMILHAFSIGQESLRRVEEGMAKDEKAMASIGDVIALAKMAKDLKSAALGGLGMDGGQTVSPAEIAAMDDAQFAAYRKRMLGV